MSLTSDQRSRIAADLNTIALMGFGCVRFLTFTAVNDPYYASWPKPNFLSFPTPAAAELENLREFFAMCTAAGLVTEVVIDLADSAGSYYNNGVTDADYQAFISALIPVCFAGELNRLYLGGDLQLGTMYPNAVVGAHQRFISKNWPWFAAQLAGCAIGMELMSGYATFWDRGADSAAWVKANLARQPDYLGFQLYPTTHAALQALGFESAGVVDWPAVARDWITGLRMACGPSIAVMCSEMGLSVGTEFSDQDQADFLSKALVTMTAEGIKAGVWEFGDHPALGDLGLFTQVRGMRKAARILLPPLALAAGAGTLPAVQYVPPEYDDLAWLLPGGVPLF